MTTTGITTQQPDQATRPREVLYALPLARKVASTRWRCRLACADFVYAVVERIWVVEVQLPLDAGSCGAEHVHGDRAHLLALAVVQPCSAAWQVRDPRDANRARLTVAWSSRGSRLV